MSNPTVSPVGPVYISVSPTMVAINFSTTLQLTPVLAGSDGLPFAATKPFTYSSSNTNLLTVDSSGLCTAVTPSDPNSLNPGGIVTVTVTYSYQNRADTDAISADSVIKVLATPATSIFSPLAPSFSFEYAQNKQGASGQGGQGVRAVPKP
jgi:hypothetical protein